MLGKHGAFIGSVALVLSVVGVGLGVASYNKPSVTEVVKTVVVSPAPSLSPSPSATASAKLKTASPSAKFFLK